MSFAWKVNFWARLQDGKPGLVNFLSKAYYAPSPDQTGHKHGRWRWIYAKAFSVHTRPSSSMGNMGQRAGSGVVLLQSQAGVIELLPAFNRWPGLPVQGSTV